MEELLGTIEDRIFNSSFYADARAVSALETSVSIKDGEITSETSRSFGIGVRVLYRGSWGFASTTEESKSSFEKIFQKAFSLAKISKGSDRLSEENFPSKKTHKKLPCASPPEETNIEDKIKIAKSLEKSLGRKQVKNTSILIRDSALKKAFINSDGACILQEYPLIYANLSAFARKNGITQRASERIGERKGYECLEGAQKASENAGKRAVNLLSARLPPKGKNTVIMDGKLSGVFAEKFGELELHQAYLHIEQAKKLLMK